VPENERQHRPAAGAGDPDRCSKSTRGRATCVSWRRRSSGR
jgi:hypothetical protein